MKVSIFFSINRVIVHPNFKNIDFKRAERILDNREKDRSDVGEVEYSQGDVIIRPSSKGNLTRFFISSLLTSPSNVLPQSPAFLKRPQKFEKTPTCHY